MRHRNEASAILGCLILICACMPAAPAWATSQDAVTAAEQDYLFVEEPPRFALVIYEQEYVDRQLRTPALKNTRSDAMRISEGLARRGYRPRLLRDPTKNDILREVDALMQGQARQEINRGVRPTVFIFFAGHGFRVDGYDYLAGSDFNKADAQNSGLPIHSLVERIAGEANLVIFSDACRTQMSKAPDQVGESMDDPSPPTDTRQPFTAPQRARMQFLTSFATAEYQIARGYSPDTPDSSPYVEAIMKEIFADGAELRKALVQVRKKVGKLTGDTQAPDLDDNGAASPDYYVAITTKDIADSREAWLAAMRANDEELVDRFIEQNSSSPYLRAAVRWKQAHATR